MIELNPDVFNEILSQDGFKVIRSHAEKIFKTHTKTECFELAESLYHHADYRIQELSVFLMGYVADEIPEALVFLRDTVSRHDDWQLQEILAMAFDSYCKACKYVNALPVIEEWLQSEQANTRRAVTEGLRIWTSRPFFKEHPEKAIGYLAPLRYDESEYVRKSVGNALRDISKKHPELIQSELQTWDLSSKQVNQVYKLASKLVNKK